MPSISILIVEDEPSIAEIIDMFLQHLGYAVAGIVDCAEKVVEQISVVRPDLVLMDIRIKGRESGIDVAHRLRKEHGIPVVFMSASSDALTVQQAVAAEPFGYLIKPIDRHVLAATLQTAVGRIQTESKLSRAEHTLTATFDCIREGVLVIDGNFRLLFMNHVAERITGWARKEALGITIVDVLKISSDCSEDVVTDLLECALTSAVPLPKSTQRLFSKSRLGDLTTVQISASPIRAARGQLEGIVIMMDRMSDAEPLIGNQPSRMTA